MGVIFINAKNTKFLLILLFHIMILIIKARDEGLKFLSHLRFEIIKSLEEKGFERLTKVHMGQVITDFLFEISIKLMLQIS